MTRLVVLACDGAFDDDRMPCRGAIGFTVDQVADAAGLIGTDVVDVDAARELAGVAGWSATDAGDYCPSHTRRQAAALEAALAERLMPRGGPTCFCPIDSPERWTPRTHVPGCPHYEPGEVTR